MKGDHRSYARAAMTCLLGFFIQVALGLALLIYSYWGGIIDGVLKVGDHAARTASGYILIVSAVWLLLAIVFDQARRERLEAMEAESLDATAARESSVFGTVSDDLRVNAKRLAWMHRVLVPAVSIAVGIALIGMGAWRYIEVTRSISGKEAEAAGAAVRGSWFEDYNGIPFQGWAISLGLGVAVVGFVFARYTSGMSKSPVYSAMRAGSSAAVAASLFGLAIALGQFAEVLGAVRVSRYLLVAFPVASMVLGAEVLVNFLLNMYRPRKPGEMPRPPVDSWLLGSVAAPDQIARNISGAIGYQFGVDVSGSWAYRLVSRSLGSLVLFAAAVVWLMTCFTIVGPDEKGLRVRLGREIGYEDPGLKFTLPWPIERIERTGTTHLHTIELATARPPSSLEHILWTNDHKTKDEVKVLVRARKGTPAGLTAAAPGAGGSGGGGGGGETAGADESLALLVVEVPLTYRIADLKLYERLSTPQAREAYVRAVARREVVRYLGTLDEEQLLSTGRTAASEQLRANVSKALADAQSGVDVVFCAIEGVHPPKDTAGSYEKVVQSQMFAQAEIERANLEASSELISAAGSSQTGSAIADELTKLNAMTAGNDAYKAQYEKVQELVRGAGGKVGSGLAAAQADRWSRHMTQRGLAEAYSGRLAAFRANPSLYFTQRYLDTWVQITQDSRLYLVDDRYKDVRMSIDLKDISTNGMTGFDAPKN